MAAITQLMVVTGITAKCETANAEMTRTMSLKDEDSFGSWNSEYSLQMPHVEGVGTGDVLMVTIETHWNAADYSLIRKDRAASKV
jgi:hypothetical protein